MQDRDMTKAAEAPSADTGSTVEPGDNGASGADYALGDQVGFLLRKAQQRHVTIFSTHMPEELTPMQFAVLAKLLETGPCSQNSLGRRTAMDVATIKGVVARLEERGLVGKLASNVDRRKLLIDLTAQGRRTVERVIPSALDVSAQTLAPLTRAEKAAFMRLLRKLT